ncbi:hypothetical protein [Mycobacterium haemophilum]|nr:hypothetical protein [Mycobacterium haemophilum]
MPGPPPRYVQGKGPLDVLGLYLDISDLVTEVNQPVRSRPQ